MPWYRGDCHVHTDRSFAGELTPAQVAVAAREFGLDFIAITEHNTTDTHGAFANAGLLVIPGQEMTTLTGHWLALGLPPGEVIDWQYGVRDAVISEHLARVHRTGGLCVAAHPHAPYPSGTFMYPFDGFDLVEVWNGQWASDRPWNADNETALKEWGRSLPAVDRRPAVGSSDTHLAGQIGLPHTVVLAPELTTTAILDGLRAGNSWITDSVAVSLTLTAAAGDSTAGIGERLETGGAPVTVRLSLEGVPEGTASLHTERGFFPAPAKLPSPVEPQAPRDLSSPHDRPPAREFPSPGERRAPRGSSAPREFEWPTSAAEAGFVRVEVRHPDGRMAAVTNPIVLA